MVVNGNSLWRSLGKPRDMVSVLCLDFALPESLRAVDRLLLKSEADLPNDRHSLFVCAECGDLGCGAVALSVKRTGEQVRWSDFGLENDHEEKVCREVQVNRMRAGIAAVAGSTGCRPGAGTYLDLHYPSFSWHRRQPSSSR